MALEPIIKKLLSYTFSPVYYTLWRVEYFPLKFIQMFCGIQGYKWSLKLQLNWSSCIAYLCILFIGYVIVNNYQILWFSICTDIYSSHFLQLWHPEAGKGFLVSHSSSGLFTPISQRRWSANSSRYYVLLKLDISLNV